MANLRRLMLPLFFFSFLAISFGQTNKFEAYKNVLILPFQDFGEKEKSLAEVLKDEIEAALTDCADCPFKSVEATFPTAMTMELSRQLTQMDTLTANDFAPLTANSGTKTPDLIVFGSYYDEKVSDNIEVKLSFYAPKTGQRIAYHVLSLNRAVAYQNARLGRIYVQSFVRNKILGLPITALKQANKQVKTVLIGTGVSLGVMGYGLVSSLNSQKNWKDYLAKNPYDTENSWKTKDKTYVNQQIALIAGGVLTAVTATVLLKKIKQKKSLSLLKELNYADVTPSVSKPKKPLFRLKLITGAQNGVLIQF